MCPGQSRLSSMPTKHPLIRPQTISLLITHTVLAGLFIIVDSLKAGVVPGVLEDFHVKRVLNFSSTARTVTSICTWETNEGVKKQVNNERK